MITAESLCQNTCTKLEHEHVAYLLSTGFSSLTGMTSTEMVFDTLCFPSDSWIEKPSARLSESSCIYISLIPGRWDEGDSNKREGRRRGGRKINRFPSKSLSHHFPLFPSCSPPPTSLLVTASLLQLAWDKPWIQQLFINPSAHHWLKNTYHGLLD